MKRHNSSRNHLIFHLFQSQPSASQFNATFLLLGTFAKRAPKQRPRTNVGAPTTASGSMRNKVAAKSTKAQSSAKLQFGLEARIRPGVFCKSCSFLIPCSGLFLPTAPDLYRHLSHFASHCLGNWHLQAPFIKLTCCPSSPLHTVFFL